jgi:hypothetical protein
MGNTKHQRTIRLKTYLIIILILLFSYSQTSGQNIEWSRAFGGNFDDMGWTVKPDKWGNLYFGGSTASRDTGDVPASCNYSPALHQNPWMIKTDSVGNIIWSKCLGTCGVIYDIEIIDSIHFIITGGLCDVNFTGDVWYKTIDTSGNVWNFDGVLGNASSDQFGVSVLKKPYGGFLGLGSTNVSTGFGSYDYYLINFDTNFNYLSFRYGGSGSDEAADLIRLHDNNYLIVGSSSSIDGHVSSNHGGTDVWVVKIDTAGQIIWEKSYGGSGFDIAFGAVELPNNNIVISGGTTSNDGDVSGNHSSDFDIWVFTIDSVGNILWQRCLGGSSNDHAKCITIDGNENIIIGGSAASNDFDVTGNHANGGVTDFWVVKLDQLGNIIGSKCFGGSSHDVLNDIEPLNDKLILVGTAESDDGDVIGHHFGGLYTKDLWALVIDTDFVTSVDFAFFQDSEISIYPSPANNYINFHFNTNKLRNNIHISIKDILGRELWQQEGLSNEKTVTIDISGLPQGIYLLTMWDKDNISTKHFIKN